MEKYIYFDNKKFTRDEKTGYYLNSTIRKRLHVYVWEYHNGKVPKGFAVHHIDHNKNNNEIDNLMIISHSKHATHHGNERAKKYYKEIVKNLNDNARPKAVIWHKSKEGREWHKKHYENMRAKLYKKVELVCLHCGRVYKSSQKGYSKFCSNKCKSAYRRVSGVDDEIRKCRYCGEDFKVNKYSKTIYCSRSCSSKAVPRLPNICKSKKDKENT